MQAIAEAKGSLSEILMKCELFKNILKDCNSEENSDILEEKISAINQSLEQMEYDLDELFS